MIGYEDARAALGSILQVIHPDYRQPTLDHVQDQVGVGPRPVGFVWTVDLYQMVRWLDEARTEFEVIRTVGYDPNVVVMA